MSNKTKKSIALGTTDFSCHYVCSPDNTKAFIHYIQVENSIVSKESKVTMGTMDTPQGRLNWKLIFKKDHFVGYLGITPGTRPAFSIHSKLCLVPAEDQGKTFIWSERDCSRLPIDKAEEYLKLYSNAVRFAKYCEDRYKDYKKEQGYYE